MSLTFDIDISDKSTREAFRKIATTILAACAEHDEPKQSDLPIAGIVDARQPFESVTAEYRRVLSQERSDTARRIRAFLSGPKVFAGHVHAIAAAIGMNPEPDGPCTYRTIAQFLKYASKGDRGYGFTVSKTGHEISVAAGSGQYAVWLLQLAP